MSTHTGSQTPTLLCGGEGPMTFECFLNCAHHQHQHHFQMTYCFFFFFFFFFWWGEGWGELWRTSLVHTEWKIECALSLGWKLMRIASNSHAALINTHFNSHSIHLWVWIEPSWFQFALPQCTLGVDARYNLHSMCIRSVVWTGLNGMCSHKVAQDVHKVGRRYCVPILVCILVVSLYVSSLSLDSSYIVHI